METVVKDNQLDYELQELHIISSHWNSDIRFVQDEIRILKNALNKYHTSAQKLPVNESAHFYKILETQNATAFTIKNKISAFLKFVELFIVDPKKEMGLDMLEKFNAVGTEIQSISAYVKLTKGLVFNFIEDAIRSGNYTEPQITPKPVSTNFRKSISFML
jgi:hypothetical protein